MGELSKDFIEHFHNLSGDTIKDKQRHLFLLFYKNRTALLGKNEELEFISANLKPTSYLEKIFRIYFLIQFRRSKELLQEFLSGDEVIMKKVRKLDWVFQDMFKEVGAEEFVNDVLPTMSYVVKLKILKKLTFDEQKNDEVFDALQKRYGIFFATTFLPKCSANKIRNTFKNNLIKLTPSQLQLIYVKDPSLIYVYFEERIKHEGSTAFMNYNPIFVYIARENPEMFAKLFNKYKMEILLGYKTTKKFIDSQKSDVLNKLESYFEILNKRALVQKLGYDLKGLFFKPVPGRSDEFYWSAFLKYYPKNKRFNVFKSFYNSTFYHKFGDNIDAINEEMLKIITDPLEQERLAKTKFEKENDPTYLKYTTPTYCFNYFKEKLSQMNVSEKAQYVEACTFCCILNKDLDCLLELSELVAEKLKNVDRSIRVNFIYPFDNNLDILDYFGEKHWKFMMDVIATATAKQDYIYYDGSIRLRYLEYLIKNDKPFREVILKYPTRVELLENNPVWKNVEICRRLLCEFIEVGPCHKDEDFFSFDVTLITLCKKFNKEHPSSPIRIADDPRIRQRVKKILDHDNYPYYYIEAVKYLICQKDTSEWLDELRMLYFKRIKSLGQTSIFLWFLKNEPIIFQKYINDFLENFSQVYNLNRKAIWNCIKRYEHLGLDKDVINFCNTKLREKGVLDDELIKVLTILSPADSHLDFLKSYKPLSNTETPDDEPNDYCKMHYDFVKCMHFVKSPNLVLPVALQFCKNDYLRFALLPLYSVLYRLPENEVKLVIQKLSEDENISVKKHAIHLSCLILDVETTHKFLKDLLVPSLMPATKFLMKNPCNYLLELVEIKLRDENKEDLDVFKLVLKKNWSLIYKTKYIQAFWEKFNDNTQTKKKLIEQLDLNIIQKLPSDLTYKLIEENMLNLKKANELIANILVHINDPTKYEIVRKILKTFKQNSLTCKTIRRDARRNLHTFIKTLFKIYFQTETSNENFAREFSSVFTSVFSLFDTFEEFVMISLLQLKGKSVETCGKILVEFNNELVTKYDKSLTDTAGRVIKEYVLPSLFKTEEDKIKLCYFVFKEKMSIVDYLLIIKLLPESEPQDAESYKFYNEIVTQLDQVNDEFICLHFNLYLTSKEEKASFEYDPRIVICPCK